MAIEPIRALANAYPQSTVFNQSEYIDYLLTIDQKINTMDASKESQVMQQIQSEMNAAFVQEFYQNVRDKCFKACITKPGASLSNSDQQCLAKCCDRYQEATEIVTKATLEMSGIQ